MEKMTDSKASDVLAELERDGDAGLTDRERHALAHAAARLREPAGVDWTNDAENWGNALNDAAWKFTEHCPEKSALLFNNTKAPLRMAILHYAAKVMEAASQSPAEAKAQDIGSEWKPCRKRPVIVHVREQSPGEQHVSTREGITAVKPDDLIMRGVEGEEYPIERELFAKTYDLVEAQAQGGREPYCYVLAGMRETVTGEVNFLCNRERQTDADIPLYTAQPPSAPVGAEGLRRMVEKLAAHVRPTCRELWEEAQAILAQQPAAVDEEAVRKAIRKVRNIAYGAEAHPSQGSRYADGMRRACNIIEAALAAHPRGSDQPQGGA